MANEIVYSDGVNIDEWLAPAIMDNLVPKIVALNAVARYNFEKGSDSVKIRKKGTLTATTAAEATDHAISPYAQVLMGTLAVQQVKVYAEFSDKANRFSNIDVPEIAEQGAIAIAQKVEQDILGLADGFSKAVGTTGQPLTAQVLRAAFYNLDVANSGGRRVVILHPTQIDDVQDDIQTSGSSLWANPTQEFTILNGEVLTDSGLKGFYLGVPIFMTTNVESIHGNVDWSGLACDADRAIGFAEDGRGIKVEYGRNIKKGVTEIGVDLFYDVKEADDASGVNIVSTK